MTRLVRTRSTYQRRHGGPRDGRPPAERRGDEATIPSTTRATSSPVYEVAGALATVATAHNPMLKASRRVRLTLSVSTPGREGARRAGQAHHRQQQAESGIGYAERPLQVRGHRGDRPDVRAGQRQHRGEQHDDPQFPVMTAVTGWTVSMAIDMTTRLGIDPVISLRRTALTQMAPSMAHRPASRPPSLIPMA